MQSDRHIVRALHAGAVLLIAGSASAAEITVTQQGVTFVPQTVKAYPGDVVRWVYTGGTHTVTSGADCTADGLFNAELTVKSTQFSWTVPTSAAGTTVPYFCEPHCIFFQTGSIFLRHSARSSALNVCIFALPTSLICLRSFSLISNASWLA